MISSIIENWNSIQIQEILIALAISLILLNLHRTLPKIPWFFFVGILGACLGMTLNTLGIKMFPTLRDNYVIDTKIEDFFMFKPMLLVKGFS